MGVKAPNLQQSDFSVLNELSGSCPQQWGSTVSIWRAILYPLILDVGVKGFLWDPHGQQLNAMQPNPTTGSFAWLQKMDNSGFSLLSPPKAHFHRFPEFSIVLGFCTLPKCP